MGKEVGMRKSKSREGRGCGFKKRKRKECYEGKQQNRLPRFLPIGIVARGGTWHCI